MKLIRTIFFYVLFLALFMVAIFIGRKINAALFGINKCTCEVNPYIAQAIQLKIKEYIQENKSQNTQDLIGLILEQFPFINKIEFSYLPGNKINVNLDIYNPFLIINDQFALLETGKLIEKNTFVEGKILFLPTLQITGEIISVKDQIPQSLVNLFQKIPREIYNKYIVTFKSSNEIFLRHKTQEHFIIVSDSQSILNYTILARCNDLKKELDARGSFERSIQNWVADIRFDRQIVLRADRGNHGKSIS